MKLSLIVPCFNEEACLPLLLARIEPLLTGAAFHPETELIETDLILVDDGSADGTWQMMQELAQRYSSLVLQRHTENRGLAEAWHTGASAASGELICLLDADLQYRPEEIPGLFQAWRESGADIVQGARENQNRSRDIRYFLSRGLSALLNALFGMSLADNKSGFLLCRRKIFLAVLKERHAFRYFQAVIMVAAHRLGYSLHSIPVSFDARLAGQSFLGKFPLRVSLGVMVDLLRALRRYRLSWRS
jgi:phenylacetate-CoA ligase